MNKVATPIQKIYYQPVALYRLLFSDTFWPDLIGHPQGVRYDTCSIHFNLAIRVLTCDKNRCCSKLHLKYN
jgi:hypothetical protein